MDVTTPAFVAALRKAVKGTLSDNETAVLLKDVMPVLIKGLEDLARANEEITTDMSSERCLRDIKPLDYLARYLYRHNPRHKKPTMEIEQLQEYMKSLES